LSGPPPHADWLVPNLIPKGSMIALCGVAGVGKSTFGYTLCMALATGTEFFGRPLVPSRVLYMDEENGHRDRRAYIYRAWVGLGCPNHVDLAQFIEIHGFALTTSSGSWDQQLRALADSFKPHLIVIDTATPACRIKDENSNGEAAVAAQKLRGVMNIAGSDCSMLVMKHLKVNHETGQVDMRGAKFWKGTVDAILYHRRPGGRPRKDGLFRSYIRPEKVRAFGLRNEIVIETHWIEDDKGLVLTGRDEPLDEKKPGHDE